MSPSIHDKIQTLIYYHKNYVRMQIQAKLAQTSNIYRR